MSISIKKNQRKINGIETREIAICFTGDDLNRIEELRAFFNFENELVLIQDALDVLENQKDIIDRHD